MPRSFLVKKTKRSIPQALVKFKHDQNFDAIEEYISRKEDAAEERSNSCKRSAFIAFSTSVKNLEGCEDDYCSLTASKNEFVPSSSPIIRKEAIHDKLTKAPHLKPVSVIYTESGVSASRDTEKENVDIIKPESINDVASVKGPLSKSKFLCQLCKSLFQDAFALAQHKCSGIKHIEHRCPECNKVFNCPANLASHRRWHRPRSPGSNKPIKVQKQSSSEESNQAFQKEMPTPESTDIPFTKDSTVENCDIGNSDEISSPIDKNNNLLDHLAVKEPSPATKYFCEYCGKSFKRHAYLRKHMFYHNKAKPYPCQYCGKVFRSQTNRAKHVLNHAIGPNSCTCPDCGSGFDNPFELEKHSRIHSSAVFSCKDCSVVFCNHAGLQKHRIKRHQIVSKI